MSQYTLNLYGTSACHLCELAAIELETALQTVSNEHSIMTEQHDIIENDDAFKQYANAIPVITLCKHNQILHELNWPFTANDIIAMFT